MLMLFSLNFPRNVNPFDLDPEYCTILIPDRSYSEMSPAFNDPIFLATEIGPSLSVNIKILTPLVNMYLEKVKKRMFTT